MITLTKNAAVYVRSIVERKGSLHHLRVQHAFGGCSGLYYDIVFNKRKTSSDKVFTTEGFKVFVDKNIKQKEQAIVDYIQTMNGPSLISNNPRFRVNLFIHE